MRRSVSDNRAYLDITEYTFQECQPSFRPQEINLTAFPPMSVMLSQREGACESEIEPLDHGPCAIIVTPVFEILDPNPIDQFTLSTLWEPLPKIVRQPSEPVEEALRILESNSFQQIEQSSEQLSCPQDQMEEAGESGWGESLLQRSQKHLSHDQEETINSNLMQFARNIEVLSAHPREQILESLTRISTQDASEEGRRDQLRRYLEQLVLEHEYPCFEEAWGQLPQCLRLTVRLLREGIKETFAKVVRAVPYQLRRLRLVRYFEKKYVQDAYSATNLEAEDRRIVQEEDRRWTTAHQRQVRQQGAGRGPTQHQLAMLGAGDQEHP